MNRKQENQNTWKASPSEDSTHLRAEPQSQGRSARHTHTKQKVKQPTPQSINNNNRASKEAGWLQRRLSPSGPLAARSAVSGQDDGGPEDAYAFPEQLHLVPELHAPAVVPVGHVAVDEQHDRGQ